MSINPRTQEAYQLFHDGILSLNRAEMQGIRVDIDYIERKKRHLTRKIEYLEEEFYSTNFYKHWSHSRGGKVNIDSNEQLSHFLYTVKKINPVKFTPSGKGATDEEALLSLNIPELNLLLERSKIKRLRDVNLDGFAREQVNGYIHSFFNLHLARTFRSSSDSPNFQNIPKRDEESMQICRRALYPRPGHQLIEIDFSGIEVRINACYNHDEQLIKDIVAGDMHRDMAIEIFMLDLFDPKEHNILRQATKNGFVFPEFYGDYYGNCANSMACGWLKLSSGVWKPNEGIIVNDDYISNHLIKKQINSLSKFEKHIQNIEEDFWNVRYKQYAEWKERWYSIYKKYGYFDLLTGFRCSGVMSRNDSTNYPAQGTAFHCLLWSFNEMDRIGRKEKWNSRLVGQIHDSMIIDAHPDETEYIIEIAKKVTTQNLPDTWKWIIVPLDVDVEICPVDGSWAEKEKYKKT